MFNVLQEVQEIKSDVGELLVSLVYNENLNRLTATIIEARRLKVRYLNVACYKIFQKKFQTSIAKRYKHRPTEIASQKFHG